MQQIGHDTGFVEIQLRDYMGYPERMYQVWLTGATHLSLVNFGGVDIGLLDLVNVCFRTMQPHLVDDIL